MDRKVWVLLFCLALIVARFFIPPRDLNWIDAYQAVAHLFFGGLAVAYYYSRRWFHLIMLIALIAVEGFVAISSRM